MSLWGKPKPATPRPSKPPKPKKPPKPAKPPKRRGSW